MCLYLGTKWHRRRATITEMRSAFSLKKYFLKMTETLNSKSWGKCHLFCNNVILREPIIGYMGLFIGLHFHFRQTSCFYLLLV